LLPVPARNIYYKYLKQRRPYASKEESREEDLFGSQKRLPEDDIRELSAQNDRTSNEVRKTAALVHELTRNMGGLNNSFGTLVEEEEKLDIAKPDTCRTW